MTADGHDHLYKRASQGELARNTRNIGKGSPRIRAETQSLLWACLDGAVECHHIILAADDHQIVVTVEGEEVGMKHFQTPAEALQEGARLKQLFCGGVG